LFFVRSLIKIFRNLYDEHLQSLIRVVFALSIAFILNQFNFDFIESYLYDIRMRLKPTSQMSGHIQTIAIDPTTIDNMNRTPNAVDHLKLLHQLKDAGAKVVIYLVNPSEVVGSYDELVALAKAAEEIPNFMIAISDVWPKSQDANFVPRPPFEKLQAVSAPYTSDLKLAAKDDVTRRMFTSFQGEVLMHPNVAALYNPEVANEKNIRGIFEFFASNQIFIDFRPTGTYPRTSFYNAMNGRFDRQVFKGNIVLIGRDIQATVDDYVRTPFSREVIAMSFLEMHANMLDTVILNSAYERTPNWLSLLITSLISMLTVYVVLAVKPTKGLAILGATLVSFSFVCFLLFWLARLWVDMSHPFLSIFVCYYFFIPYRLIIENRRSWEYLQKNRLLTQVEELKTNFLSMMSHDLKTPLSRIRGMTDVALNDSQALSNRQKDALINVQKSCDELVEFISSVLNLGRVESKELQLHMTSKDANQLLDEVIEKCEYAAKQKNIEIQREYETLFSFKMDVDLIRQVFSNLIENAIKYSPENSRVLVSTEEHDGLVVIQIADQGFGIPQDEIGHVFMKFYRSKSAKSSTIKGSGLGLYLAKYFVELHRGNITVDSSLGQGSTFTVELPQTQTEAP
jgi:signal transduction histidine kinase